MAQPAPLGGDTLKLFRRVQNLLAVHEHQLKSKLDELLQMVQGRRQVPPDDTNEAIRALRDDLMGNQREITETTMHLGAIMEEVHKQIQGINLGKMEGIPETVETLKEQNINMQQRIADLQQSVDALVAEGLPPPPPEIGEPLPLPDPDVRLPQTIDGEGDEEEGEGGPPTEEQLKEALRRSGKEEERTGLTPTRLQEIKSRLRPVEQVREVKKRAGDVAEAISDALSKIRERLEPDPEDWLEEEYIDQLVDNETWTEERAQIYRNLKEKGEREWLTNDEVKHLTQNDFWSKRQAREYKERRDSSKEWEKLEDDLEEWGAGKMASLPEYVKEGDDEEEDITGQRRFMARAEAITITPEFAGNVLEEFHDRYGRLPRSQDETARFLTYMYFLGKAEF